MPEPFHHLRNHSGPPRNTFRYFSYLISLSRNYPKRHHNLKCVTLRFENNADMTETPLRSMINSGTWRSVMTPTRSTNNIDRLNHKHRT